MMRRLYITFFILCSFSTQANLFKIENRTGTCILVCGTLEDLINENLPDADQSTYLEGMADSGAMAQRGIGVDYASEMEFISMGYSLGLGADLGENSLGDFISGDVDASQFSGFGAAITATFGLNLGLIVKDWKHTNVFLSYLRTKAPNVADDLSGNINSFGVHFLSTIIPGRSAFLGTIKWGGIKLSTGLERTALELSFSQTITETVSSGGITGAFTGEVVVGAEVETYSIPIEVVTSFEIAHALGVYVGTGLDYNWGASKSIVSLTGTPDIPGGTGTAALDLGQDASPTSLGFRTFLGFQLGFFGLNLFTHLQRDFLSGAYGIGLGIRFTR